MRHRSFVMLGMAWLAASIALGVMAPVVGAHAAYKYSNPDDESTVDQPPVEIWAEYTEPPTDASYMRVYDPCGAQVDNGDSRAAPAQNRVYITMSSDRSGAYRVDWFVDSAVDAHSTRGTFTFTVTNGAPCPGSETAEEERERREQAAPRRNDPTRETSDDAPFDAAAGGDTPNDTGGRSADRSGDVGRSRRNGTKQGQNEVAEPATAADTGEVKPEEPGLFEGIPVGGLVLGLAFAAGIGGAGGLIYAGIMGYNRS